MYVSSYMLFLHCMYLFLISWYLVPSYFMDILYKAIGYQGDSSSSPAYSSFYIFARRLAWPMMLWTSSKQVCGVVDIFVSGQRFESWQSFVLPVLLHDWDMDTE